MAGILSGLFLPSRDALASLIAVDGIFAAGFAMGPVGAAGPTRLLAGAPAACLRSWLSSPSGSSSPCATAAASRCVQRSVDARPGEGSRSALLLAGGIGL